MGSFGKDGWALLGRMGGLFWYSNWLVLFNIFITDYRKKQMCNFADNNTISATATIFSYSYSYIFLSKLNSARVIQT